MAKGKNIIIGKRGFLINDSFCGYKPSNFIENEKDVVDHAAVPLLFRPFYIKLEARHNPYRLFGGEDIALSLNSYKLCNITSHKIGMKLIEKQRDGNNQKRDRQIISAYKKEKEANFNLFLNIYCYLIRSGYIPRRWVDFNIPIKDYLNI